MGYGGDAAGLFLKTALTHMSEHGMNFPGPQFSDLNWKVLSRRL
jgi:hypothetical protein